jgi:DNA replication and repair protein RecF
VGGWWVAYQASPACPSHVDLSHSQITIHHSRHIQSFNHSLIQSLFLEILILANFKNYEFQQVDCSAGLNCFLGMNGMGKTNLLDAIYYLCMTKSYFGLPDSGIVRHGEEFFRLEGKFTIDGRGEKIVAKVIPRGKKEMERNGVGYQRLSEHVGLIPVVIITPDDNYIISEGSEARRRFLDNTLSQIDGEYLNQLMVYNQVLKQRNAALKASGAYNPALIEVYDRQLAGPAGFIFQKRAEFLERFRVTLLEMHKYISGKNETVDCSYRSQLSERSLAELLKENAEKDRMLERTTAGIHKDDLVFHLGDHPLKRFGSQGQLKSFVLALKLAQYELLKIEKKTQPILLLDDIFDKLDKQRVAYLMQLLLSGDFGQIFITDTDEDRIGEIIRQSGREHRKFRIERGKAQLIED